MREVTERMSLPEDYREAIGQAIGTASVCWTPRPSDAVFDSTAASAIADELIARFAHVTEERDRARAEVERLTANCNVVGCTAQQTHHHLDEVPGPVLCTGESDDYDRFLSTCCELGPLLKPNLAPHGPEEPCIELKALQA